jgi:hypothetical protein
VFTASAAPEVSEQLSVSVSAGDPLTDKLLAALRDALGVPAAMSDNQFKEALQAQGFVERKSGSSSATSAPAGKAAPAAAAKPAPAAAKPETTKPVTTKPVTAKPVTTKPVLAPPALSAPVIRGTAHQARSALAQLVEAQLLRSYESTFKPKLTSSRRMPWMVREAVHEAYALEDMPCMQVLTTAPAPLPTGARGGARALRYAVARAHRRRCASGGRRGSSRRAAC